MRGDGLLDWMPLWGLLIATLLLVLASIEAGYRLGRSMLARSEREKEAPVGAMAGATLGLLAFLLAFTFGMAAARFEARREIILEESNAIGTAYLRAVLLPERGEEIRALLREYVDVRLRAVASGGIAEGIRRSEELQVRLWAQVSAVGEKNRDSELVALFVSALNNVIDLHSKRVMVGVRSRIPGAIWIALFSVTVLALAVMGYHTGLAGASRSVAAVAVALTFSAVIWLIADLDRPLEGSLEVSQQAMIDLRTSMGAPGP